ncbi:sialidase [Bacillus tianshenii]|uniref:F510_1955 family glycosylhydrolase n=1 Tax=Sutcliffiella tianshenii TaxID=1463404 RepID=UPI001CD32F7D|nr:sialidase [Bacillus tianshenii]MCA1321473.1 sialidase [Bacillus tianshenii]
MKKMKLIILMSLISILVIGCSSKGQNDEYFIEAKNETINHIHGIGYLGDKKELFLATHHGLFRFTEEKWYKTSRNNHDYMGFQATDEQFFSSGHPELGSDLKNPLGLIKSKDKGNSMEKLAFYGEIDFHYLAAGYKSHTLYVFNEQENSLKIGLHYSIDEGQTWETASMKGISANSIGNIATHPTVSENVAISTNKGLFISSDFGNEFKLLTSSNPVTTVEYQEDSLIYFILENNETKLLTYNLKNETTDELSLPEGVSSKNPIMFIATNPENRTEITAVSLNNDIFQSHDNGASWKLLVEEGNVMNE